MKFDRPKCSSLVKALRPEEQLVVSCAQTVVPVDVAKRIRELASAGLDWDYVFEMARQNFVAPLVSFTLLKTCPDLLPDKVRLGLDGQLRDHVRNNLLQTRELVLAVKLLRENGIPTLQLKGPTLSLLAYGDLSFR